MVRGALFKRTEEEKGLGGWAPAPRRGIRTVGITDSAISVGEAQQLIDEAVGELAERLQGSDAEELLAELTAAGA